MRRKAEITIERENNPMVMTNADRIRCMTDEELAEIIKCPLKGRKCLWEESCKECCVRWLKEKCEE